MVKAFICYSSKDIYLAKIIYEILANYNMYVWLDINEINPGDNVLSKIQDGINGAQILIAIVTGDSVKSRWVEEELRMAISESVNPFAPKVITVSYDQTELKNIGRPYAEIAINPYDFKEILARKLDQAVRPILIEQSVYANPPENHKNDNYAFAKELSLESAITISEKGDFGKSKGKKMEDRQIGSQIECKNAIQKLLKNARSYRLKANITLGIMIVLIALGLLIFYRAASIARWDQHILNTSKIDTTISNPIKK